MSSRGDLRENGMVFIGNHKGFKSGEYCIPMSRFLEKYGVDFYEKKARAKSNKAAVKDASIRAKAKREWIEANKDALVAAKKEKDKIAELIIKKKPKLSGRSVIDLLIFTGKKQMADIIGRLIIEKNPEFSVFQLLQYATDKKQMAQIINQYHKNKTPEIQKIIDKYLHEL